MTDKNRELRKLIDEVATYLEHQKAIGHPGVPAKLLLKSKEAALRAKQGEVVSSVTDTNDSRSAREIAIAMAKGETIKKPSTVKKEKLVSKTTVDSPMKTQNKDAKEISLDSIREKIGDCKRCKLHEGRNKLVFGEGNEQADIMFIGEGPGADEDKQGRPFVGRAGQLLTRWIELGMGLKREDVYIANIVKCRPPNNRDPEKDEVASCIGFVLEQIQAIQPKAIVLLGRVPMNHLLKVREGITKVHGTWYRLNGIPTMPIFHPSYCLRPPLDEKRRAIWEDIKKLLTYLDMPIPKKNSAEK